MVSCSVPGCDVTRRNNPNKHTFHRFPRNSALMEKWMRTINRPDWTPSTNSTICSKHFGGKCFIQRKHRRVLMKDSIPTLFVPVKLPRRRPVSSYVNRDITLSPEVVTPSPHAEPTPGPSNLPLAEPTPGPSNLPLAAPTTGPSNLILSPRKRKLMDRNKKLKRKILQKNRVLKNLREKVKRMTKRILTLQEVVKELNNRPGLENHRNDVEVACRNDLLQKLVNRVNGRATGKISRTAEYDEELKKLALTIHFYSPRSYVYIRDKFDLCLPHVNTLQKWYSRLNCEPGFTKESFNTISEIAKKKPIYVNLTFDEIKIREETEFVGKKHYGYVNVGNDLCGDEIEIAKEVVVFMVVAVNGYWKLPVGFFPAKSFTASEKSRLLKICLDLLKDTNCDVVAITFDGIASNLTMAQTLGASLLKPPYKPYFMYNGKKYNILFDPCHLIKLIRNCFADHKIFYDNMGRKIDFKFVENLQSLQKSEGLHLANKLSARHIDFRTQKMKVRLAAQLLSRSVGVAIDVCNKDLCIDEFQNSEATVQFLHHVNDIFDIFNSKNLNNYGFKKPLCPSNKEDVFCKIDEVNEYFQLLKCQDGRYVINTQRRLGFLGFIHNIISLKWMYVSYIEKKDHLKFLPVYKLSQDHLETFFSAIRSKGGFNNNPTVKNFISAYKRLLCHTEIKISESGNCLELEKITVLSTSAMSTIDKINSSSNYNKIFKELLQDSNDAKAQNEETNFDEQIVLIDNTASLSQMSMMIVSYVSGFVVRKLTKKIKCDVCVQSLVSKSSEIFYNSLIVKKDYSQTDKLYLTYPSNDVIKLCRYAESFFRENMKNKAMTEIIFAKCVLKVLRNVQSLFNNLQNHIFDQDPLNNHRYFLMKSIIEIYFNLRFKHENKLLKLSRETIRTHLNKTVIFRGQ